MSVKDIILKGDKILKYTGAINSIVIKAKRNKKTIVLPDSEDSRILKATSNIIDDDIASIVLLGDKEKIKQQCKLENISIDFDKVKIENPITSEKRQKYAEALYELRKAKGITLDLAYKMLDDSIYFGTMMVKLSDADGMVSGAIHSTSSTLRPALQIIKAVPNIKNVSSFFLMDITKSEYAKKYIFADCGLIEFPTKEQLIDIVLSSVTSYRQFIGNDPKVALLSYSTKGSAKDASIDKLVSVIEMLKTMNVDFEFDGELQLDAAIDKNVASFKAPSSKVAGNANILIFPDIQAGNIGYKLVQRFGGAIALGPVTQGLAKPINDLSRGCNVEEIIGTVAITCVQAQAMK